MGQRELVERLLDAFGMGGYDEDLAVADVLDSLATAGLKLVEDDGEVSNAYIEEVAMATGKES